MIKTNVSMNLDFFFIWMHYEGGNNPWTWIFGERYWDLVISYLNEDYEHITSNAHNSFGEDKDFEFLEMLQILPAPADLDSSVIEDLNVLKLDVMKEFVDKVFVDNVHLKLTAVQKYCALMTAWKYDDSAFSDLLGFYNYTAKVSTHYEISSALSEFVYSSAKDIETYADEATIAEYVYGELCKEIANSEIGSSDIKAYKSYEFPSLHDTVAFLLHEMVQNNCNVKKCPNCNRYFVPLNRSDTIYCGLTSPQMPNKTCQEYRKYMNSLEKTKTDEAVRLYKQLYNAKNNKARRCKTKDNPKGNPALNADLVSFVNTAANYRRKIKAGVLSEDEYIIWLRTTKEGKEK